MDKAIDLKAVALAVGLKPATARRWLWKLDIEPKRIELVTQGKRVFPRGLYDPRVIKAIKAAREEVAV